MVLDLEVLLRFLPSSTELLARVFFACFFEPLSDSVHSYFDLFCGLVIIVGPPRLRVMGCISFFLSIG